jgi:hypothetical protein
MKKEKSNLKRKVYFEIFEENGDMDPEPLTKEKIIYEVREDPDYDIHVLEFPKGIVGVQNIQDAVKWLLSQVDNIDPINNQYMVDTIKIAFKGVLDNDEKIQNRR